LPGDTTKTPVTEDATLTAAILIGAVVCVALFIALAKTGSGAATGLGTIRAVNLLA
jgi:hypothetical protein